MVLGFAPHADNPVRGKPSRLPMRFPLAVLGQATTVQGETGSQSADAVARELANPDASLATLTLKNQYRLYTGDLPQTHDQRNYSALFQPVCPLSLPTPEHGGKATFFVRPAFPLLPDQPTPRAGRGGLECVKVTTIGDIGSDVAHGESRTKGVLWAVGMVGTLPNGQ